MNTAPNCGARPSACPADWNLRCIRDPCVCSRSIWVDEDLRIAEPACTAAVEPACATSCPTQFSCPGLAPPLKCIQERCTCRPIVDPLSIPQVDPRLIAQQMQMQMGGQMGPQGQMGQGQMGPQGHMGAPAQGKGPQGQAQSQMGGQMAPQGKAAGGKAPTG